MRIVLCLPHLKISGGVRVMLTYARELKVLGHEVTVLAHESSRRKLWFKKVFSPKLKWFALPQEVKVAYVSQTLADKTIARISPDVVIADSAPIAWWFINSPFKTVEMIQHDERLYHGEPLQVAEIYRSPLKKIVVSTWLKDRLKADFNVEAELLLNSFDRELFKPVPRAKANDGKIRVLVLDHPYKWKGTEEAIKMVRELQLKYPQVVLMGLGARQDLEKNKFDEFYFSPPQTKLVEIYSRADIYLCSSWDEGFGLPSLEAMACGTALLTYDNGGSRDFAQDGKTALVAPRQDHETLKTKLVSLITDDALRARISAAGLSFTRAWPSWEDQAKKLEKILKSAITQ